MARLSGHFGREEPGMCQAERVLVPAGRLNANLAVGTIARMSDEMFHTEIDGETLRASDIQFAVSLPIWWAPDNDNGLGGPPVVDAGTLHISVAHEGEDLFGEGLTVSVSLGDILEEQLEGAVTLPGYPNEGYVEGKRVDALKQIANELRVQASRLDEAIVPSQRVGLAPAEALAKLRAGNVTEGDLAAIAECFERLVGKPEMRGQREEEAATESPRPRG